MTAPLKIARKRKKAGPFAGIEDAIEAFRAGEMIIVCDDEDRENEGDLTLAAEKVTPKAINFMAKYGRGLICMPMTGQRLDELEIPLMVNRGPGRRTLPDRATCSHCGRNPAECSCGRVRPKRQSISRGLAGCIPPASSAKS